MSNETMFNNELKEGVKRKMLNHINDNELKDIIKNNDDKIIINNTYNYNPCITNSNNEYNNSDNDYSNYNNKYSDCKWEIPLSHMVDNNSNSLFNNKKQISEDDIKNSKIYKELEEKYNNKLNECNILKNECIKLKEKIINDIPIIKQMLEYKENKCLDKKYLNILFNLLDGILSLFKNDNLIENNKDGE